MGILITLLLTLGALAFAILSIWNLADRIREKRKRNPHRSWWT
jgi:hypothetical protein